MKNINAPDYDSPCGWCLECENWVCIDATPMVDVSEPETMYTFKCTTVNHDEDGYPVECGNIREHQVNELERKVDREEH